jgi:hypothetical protein
MALGEYKNIDPMLITLQKDFCNMYTRHPFLYVLLFGLLDTMASSLYPQRSRCTCAPRPYHTRRNGSRFPDTVNIPSKTHQREFASPKRLIWA